MFLGTTACSASGDRAGFSRASDSRASVSGAGSSRNNITRSQIDVVPDGTAFTVVEQLRPHWLNARTQATPWNPEPAYAMVFVDHLRWGTIYTLDRISTTQIDRIEYLNATDATIRYGLGYLGGIIRVITITH
jgi:hypothetical protein